MLYDARKAGIWSRENFVIWLGNQPRHQRYNYTDPDNCAAALYLKAHGIEGYSLSVEQLRVLEWNTIVNGMIDTMGAAYIRGRGGRVRHIGKSIMELFQ
jgi:hypothetical protein